MTDWTTISQLATAGGTLVLAVATFASIRQGNRATRLAEQSLLAQNRPLLMNSRIEDPPQKVGFFDSYFVRVEGGSGTAEVTDGIVRLTMSMRNAGTGIAVLHAWQAHSIERGRDVQRPDIDSFRRLTRDIYIAAGDIGFWQGAIREKEDSQLEEISDWVTTRVAFNVDVLYGDALGGQRVVSRFLMTPRPDGDAWMVSVGRHWNVDNPDPR